MNWPGKTYNWFRTFVAEVAGSYRALEALRILVVAAIRGQTTGGAARTIRLGLSSCSNRTALTDVLTFLSV